MRVEKKQVEELKAKLQDIERRKSKRQKVTEKDTVDLKVKQQQEIQALREKYSGVDHYQALCKIMKHLMAAKDQAKFTKCLGMIEELIRESFDFLTTSVGEGDEIETNGNVLFNTFDAIMRCERKFETPQDRQLVEKLYLFLIELSENEEDLFTEEQEKILDLYYIPVYVQSNLITDDSFKVRTPFL